MIKTIPMKTQTIIQDNQSRIVRFSIPNAYQIIDGAKVHASAYAKKKGNYLIVSDAYEGTFNENGQSVVGVYRIVSSKPQGKLTFLECFK